MSPNEYQKLAMKTLNPKLSKKDVLINGVMGLCGESGEAIDIVKDCVVKAQALTIEHLLGIIIKKLHASFEGKLMGVHVRIRKPEILTETKNLGVCATRFF